MSSFLTPTLIVHLAGVVAVSQLLMSSDYRRSLYQNLNKNATSAIHEALDRVADAVAVFLPVDGELIGLGTVLQTVVYGAAALYALYLTRSVESESVFWHPVTCPCM